MARFIYKNISKKALQYWSAFFCEIASSIRDTTNIQKFIEVRCLFTAKIMGIAFLFTAHEEENVAVLNNLSTLIQCYKEQIVTGMCVISPSILLIIFVKILRNGKPKLNTV